MGEAGSSAQVIRAQFSSCRPGTSQHSKLRNGDLPMPSMHARWRWGTKSQISQMLRCKLLHAQRKPRSEHFAHEPSRQQPNPAADCSIVLSLIHLELGHFLCLAEPQTDECGATF